MSEGGRIMRLAAAVLLAMLGVVAACDSTTEHGGAPATTSASHRPATDVYEVPDQIRDATMVWSAEPGIDLLATEGTLIRAALESFAIGSLAGLDYTYLGFADSSNSVAGGPLYSLFRADTGQGPFAGTLHGHLQQIVPTEVGFDVISCVLSVGLDVKVDGKYSPSGLAGGEGGELRSRFIRTGEAAKSPVVKQSSSSTGPDSRHWQAPTGNQFIGWEIDGFTDRDPTTSGNGRCARWARSLYPHTTPAIARDAYARDNPPPVQPAYPGWPDSSH
ncbi:hypothetical protein [Rhodococcus sp. 1168]|uniref:hypothetical protein n=1 Tax=Rhodococcus sp. 1168 TaxID=2018041 RepID=UPI000A0E351A|nr:hypothetical protein [Rhodococcus sp. 1168]ORI21117.1 hypothetical protein BJI47_16845 [Rhodococcus sp. 1168]